MNLRCMLFAVILGITIGTVAVRAQSSEPGDCPNDSKLLNGGPTAVFGEGDGTWWGLVIGGLQDAEIFDQRDQINYLNHVFGTNFECPEGLEFQCLEDLKTYNLNLLEQTWDKNGNGFICAYELRGTRAYYDDPLINKTFFGVSDDKIPKK